MEAPIESQWDVYNSFSEEPPGSLQTESDPEKHQAQGLA